MAAIQDGQRRAVNWRALVPSNPGSARWERFFREMEGNKADSSRLRAVWGSAEQQATDYGAIRAARSRTPTKHEIGLKLITDIWRAGVGHIEQARVSVNDHYCRTIRVCIRVGDLTTIWMRDWIFDPRNRANIRWLAHYGWHLLDWTDAFG